MLRNRLAERDARVAELESECSEAKDRCSAAEQKVTELEAALASSNAALSEREATIVSNTAGSQAALGALGLRISQLEPVAEKCAKLEAYVKLLTEDIVKLGGEPTEMSTE